MILNKYVESWIGECTGVFYLMNNDTDNVSSCYPGQCHYSQLTFRVDLGNNYPFE